MGRAAHPLAELRTLSYALSDVQGSTAWTPRAILVWVLEGAWSQELAMGFDWKVTRDGPVERDFCHWKHWRPSSQFRMSLIRQQPNPTPQASFD